MIDSGGGVVDGAGFGTFSSRFHGVSDNGSVSANAAEGIYQCHNKRCNSLKKTMFESFLHSHKPPSNGKFSYSNILCQLKKVYQTTPVR